MSKVKVDIDKLIDGYYESDIHRFYSKHGGRANYYAELKLRNSTEYGKKLASYGGKKNILSGHLDRLNNEILTAEKRKENKEIKIPKSKLLKLQSKYESVSDIVKHLNITQSTYRKLCKEYNIYENKNFNKTYKKCKYCGIKTDLANYNGYHGSKCIGRKITKDLLIDTHKRFIVMKDILSQLKISRKIYYRLCNHNNIESVKLNNSERSKIGSSKTSKSVKVWKVDNTKKDLKGKYLGEFKSQSEAARTLGVSRQLILDTLKGRYKKPTKIIVEN